MNENLEDEVFYMDQALLSKEYLMDYDLERTNYNVSKFFKDYKKLKCKCYGDIHLKITTNYKYIYVDTMSCVSSDNYTNIDYKIDCRAKYSELNKKIAQITNLFSQEEIVYFTLCLMNEKSEYSAYTEIGCSNKGLNPIKNSCIVKFASAFDLEICKGEKLSDEDELKFNLCIQ